MFDMLWLCTALHRYAYFAEGQLWQTDMPDEGVKIFRAKVLRHAPTLGGVFADVGTDNVLVQCGKERLPNVGDSIYVWEAEPAKGGKLAVCKLHPTLADSLVVLCVGTTGVHFAKGLDEATRLACLEALGDSETGCIVRSAVTPADVPDLVRQLHDLEAKWHQIATTVGVGLLYQAECDLSEYRATAHEIWSDDPALCEALGAQYVPDLAARWPQHVEAPLALLGERVTCAEGVELVLQRTEACWVIDVNSGGYMPNLPADKAALAVNRIAGQEALRQLCLRNATGAVLIDFVNMGAEGRHALWRYLEEQSARDRRVHLVDMTKLGFVELTRSAR